MKTTPFYYSAFTVLITVILISCSGGTNNLISKKWKMSELNSPNIERMITGSEANLKSLEDSIAATTDTTKIKLYINHKDQIKAMMDMLNQKMEEMKSNSFMEFKKDGTYEAKMGDGNEKGKWEIAASGKYLVSQTDGQEKKDSIEIIELTAEKLVLSKDSTTMTFAPAPAENK